MSDDLKKAIADAKMVAEGINKVIMGCETLAKEALVIIKTTDEGFGSTLEALAGKGKKPHSTEPLFHSLNKIADTSKSLAVVAGVVASLMQVRHPEWKRDERNDTTISETQTLGDVIKSIHENMKQSNTE